MRIAVLADPIDNQNAGIHVYTREMVDALIRTNPGHEIILIREKIDPAQSGIKQIAIPNTRLPIGFASLRLFIIVPAVLWLKRADVVIEPAHFGPFNLLPKVKRVTVIHDLTPILFPKLHRWHSQMLQKLFLKNILRKTDIIISNSLNTESDICSVYPEVCSKVHKINPGISEIFKPIFNEDVLKKYKITRPYFLFTGTIEPRKNLLILLEAFKIFSSRINNIQLVFAGGKGWKAEPFFTAVATHPNKDQIVCTGFVPNEDLPGLYSHATAFIYPSMYEGFGLPIIEAMSCGTPVIAARNSSLPEAGGETALYFETANPSQLCDLMVTLYENPAQRAMLSSKAIIHASGFSWDKFGAEFWQIIK